PVRYQRHRPEATELHRIVRDNLDALRDPPEDVGRGAPPAFVLKTFEQYLSCGLLCRGFLRAGLPRLPRRAPAHRRRHHRVLGREQDPRPPRPQRRAPTVSTPATSRRLPRRLRPPD